MVVTLARQARGIVGLASALTLLGSLAAGCSGSAANEDSGEPALPNSHFRFGETTTDVAATRDQIPLAITVTRPEEFTPVEPAEEQLATNMFFIVTVENLSKDERDVYSPKILTEACSDEESQWLIPCDTPGNIIYTDGKWTDYPDELLPGDTMTFRVEYSLASDTFVALELDLGGRSGARVTFVTDAVTVD